MNNQKRKQLSKLMDTLYDVKEEISSLLEEERKAFDNIPESLREAEKNLYMRSGIDDLEDAISSIDVAIQAIEGASL